MRHIVRDVREVLAQRSLLTLTLAAAIVVVPTVLLLVRWDDPSRGQIPFGWQMHSSCWGAVDDPSCSP